MEQNCDEQLGLMTLTFVGLAENCINAERLQG